MSLDLRIFYFFNDLAGRSYFFDAAIVFFASYFQYILVAAFVLFLIYSKRERKDKITIASVVGLAVVLSRGVLVEIIRFFYHRPRPFVGYSVNQLILKNSYSFPSGHAAFFFALAAAVYFYNKKLGFWLFVGSALVVLSRIAAGIHYPSDIIGGIIVGLFSAFLVFRLYPKNC